MKELEKKIEDLELKVQELENELEKKNTKIEEMESEMSDIYYIVKKY
jgi:chaperonin cofactor prefoldin